MFISSKVWSDTCNKMLLSGLWYRCLDLAIYTDLFTLINLNFSPQFFMHLFYSVNTNWLIFLQLHWKRIWLTRNFAIESIYENNCQIQNCHQTLELPSNWKNYLLSFPSCSSTSNTVKGVDDHQCKSIRMGVESTLKLPCTNNHPLGACTKRIIEFRSLWL